MPNIQPIMTNRNGNAPTMEILCVIASPSSLERSKKIDNNVTATPHTPFTFPDGFKFPLLLKIPNTNVPEFADVTKKVHTRHTTILTITIKRYSVLYIVIQRMSRFIVFCVFEKNMNKTTF